MSNYVVSARKYRPMRFDEVVGQNHVSRTLKNALKTNHLGHSFLFCGPRGVGKTTSARILAKVLNCENRTEDFEPCNGCSSCKAFNENNSFNIYELDAASNNGVDHMRDLVEQVRFPPQQGEYKVYIIDEVHMLSQAAFNAFLKTLEEPPSYAVFILATTEKHKILPTILSRCQIYDFHRVRVEDMIAHLQEICVVEGYTAEEAALHTIAQKADGALRDALSLFDRIVSFAGTEITYQKVVESLNILDYETFFSLTNALILQDKNSILQQFNQISLNGFDGDQVIIGLAEHFRNLLMAQDKATIELLEVSDDVKAEYLQQAKQVKLSFLLNALNIANTCDLGYRQAKNKRLHVEIALLKMCFAGSQVKNQPLEVGEPEKKNLDKPELVEKPSSKQTKPLAEQPKQKEVKDFEEEMKEDSIPETTIEIEEEVTQQENEKKPKRIIAPKGNGFHLSQLDSKVAEQSKQLESVEQKTQEEEALEERQSFEENEQKTIQAAWYSLEEYFHKKGKPILSNAIKDSGFNIDENKVQVEVNGDIEKEILTEHYYEITDLIKDKAQVNRFSFEIKALQIKQENQKTYTKQEQLDYLKQQNPDIVDFCRQFDLQIDYEK